MTNTNDIAGILLPHTRSSQVADLLFSRATVEHAISLSAPLSDAVAANHVKGQIGRSLTVSSSEHTSSTVLAKMSKDTRITVRRALLANPSTPYETVLALNHWAHAKEDKSSQGDECISTAILRLKAHDMVDVITKSGMRCFNGHYGYPFDKIAAAVVAERDAALVTSAYALGITELCNELAVAVYEQSSPVVTLTELVTASEDKRTDALTSLVETQQMCSLELAELLSGNSKAVNSYRSRFVLVGDGADAALLRSPHASVRHLALLSGVRGELLDSTIAEASDVTALNAVILTVGAQLSAKQEVAALKRYQQFFAAGASVPSRTLVMVLSACRRRVAKQQLLSLLRAGGHELTSAWVTGQFPANLPRPGELTALVEEPGSAFTAPPTRHHWNAAPTTTESTPEERVRNLLVSTMNGALRGDCADEVASHLGSALLPNIGTRPRAARYVTSRFEAAFNDDMACWETVLSLAGDWTSSIDELVETTYAINGIDPDELPEPAEPVAAPEPLMLDL